MKIALTPFWVMLAVMASPALAVEKCVGADGKISYRDRCPAGTRAPSTTDEQLIPKPSPGTTIIKPQIKPIPEASPGAPITVKPIPPPPPAAVLAQAPADVQLDYYDLEASDHASLVKALNARGADLVRSSWKLSYQYKPGRELGRCVVGPVTTKLELAMTLPRWSPPPGTPQDLVERWQRYLIALMSHQNTRLERARAFERALKPALAAVPPAANCDALDVEVYEVYAELQRQAQAREVEPADTAKLVFE
jgi:predicted secreted Zn-dependent protease